MVSTKRLRQRVVDRYHLISRAVKKFQRKPPGEKKDVGIGKAKEPVIKAEVLSGGSTAGAVEATDATEVVATGDEEQQLRILTAGGDDIHADWKVFTDRAVAENLITDLRVSSGDNVTCSSTRFFGCTFSTDSVQRAFEVPRIENIEDSIVLGLQNVGAASNNVSAAALITAFGIDISDLSDPVKTILSTLSSPGASQTFSVANEDGLKNATWIRTLDANTLEVISS
jgi:hypothetical protein